MSIVKPRQEGAFFKAPRNFEKRGPGRFPIGKRTKRRAAENRRLGLLNISRCEIHINGNCADRVMLTWAHSKKSRFLATHKDWQEAARCCLPCHQRLEAMSHKEMHAIIVAAIKRRRPNV